MRVLIWIFTFLIGSIVNLAIGNLIGIKAGAVLLYLIDVFIAKKLCQKWDERSKSKAELPDNSSRTALSVPSAPGTTSQQKEVFIVAATEEGQSTSSKVAYCRKCGKKLLPDSLFCSYCGAEVIFEKNVCRFCGNELADGSVF